MDRIKAEECFYPRFFDDSIYQLILSVMNFTIDFSDQDTINLIEQSGSYPLKQMLSHHTINKHNEFYKFDLSELVCISCQYNFHKLMRYLFENHPVTEYDAVEFNDDFLPHPDELFERVFAKDMYDTDTIDTIIMITKKFNIDPMNVLRHFNKDNVYRFEDITWFLEFDTNPANSIVLPFEIVIRMRPEVIEECDLKITGNLFRPDLYDNQLHFRRFITRFSHKYMNEYVNFMKTNPTNKTISQVINRYSRYFMRLSELKTKISPDLLAVLLIDNKDYRDRKAFINSEDPLARMFAKMSDNQIIVQLIKLGELDLLKLTVELQFPLRDYDDRELFDLIEYATENDHKEISLYLIRRSFWFEK
jgi:hypothetical protein